MTDLGIQLREQSGSEDGSPGWTRTPGGEREGLPGRRLLCRACGTPITTEGARIEVGGAARHRRTNPAGLSFEFECFAEAPGARSSGPGTAEHSWFPDYRWSFSLCRRCGTQLGWRFVGPPPSFHGLIGERLEPESD